MTSAVFTFDIENPHPTDARAHVTPSARVLDLLEGHGVTGSVFFVAETARQAPHLVRRVVEAGHEVGLHSLDHTEVTRQRPEQFRRDTARAKAQLEDLCGHEISGYRAPVFSIVRATRWAIDILGELGFTWSSSVLPARNPLNGYAGAPADVFEWRNGIIEFPAPVMPVLGLPYFGGIYFRYLPLALSLRLLRSDDAPVKWFYAHPYDFAPEQGFYRMKNVKPWANRLLMANRGGALGKLEALLAGGNVEWLPGFESQITRHRPPAAVPADS